MYFAITKKIKYFIATRQRMNASRSNKNTTTTVSDYKRRYKLYKMLHPNENIDSDQNNQQQQQPTSKSALEVVYGSCSLARPAALPRIGSHSLNFLHSRSTETLSTREFERMFVFFHKHPHMCGLDKPSIHDASMHNNATFYSRGGPTYSLKRAFPITNNQHSRSHVGAVTGTPV